MKILALKKILLGILFFSLSSLTIGKELYGEVVEVHDGDTIWVKDQHHRRHKVRLKHIDAPELLQAFGTEARQALSKQLYRKIIKVIYYDNDKYHRILGTVYFNGKNINLEMVKKGYAWAYHHTKKVRYKQAEKTAQSLKKGLWKHANPEYPWDWKQRMRHQ